MKLWIYENYICELQSEELFKGRSLQLYTQLMPLRKESLKKNSGLYGIWTLVLCDSGAALYQIKLTSQLGGGHWRIGQLIGKL